MMLVATQGTMAIQSCPKTPQVRAGLRWRRNRGRQWHPADARVSRAGSRNTSARERGAVPARSCAAAEPGSAPARTATTSSLSSSSVTVKIRFRSSAVFSAMHSAYCAPLRRIALTATDSGRAGQLEAAHDDQSLDRPPRGQRSWQYPPASFHNRALGLT
jgi:hypothetical protein